MCPVMINEELTNDKKKYIVLLMIKIEFIYNMYLFIQTKLWKMFSNLCFEIAFS